MTTNLNDLAQQIHANAKAKGFYDEPRNTGELFMLMVSELGEALDADRKGKRCIVKDFEKWMLRYGTESVFQNNFEVDIKGTFEEEIADVVIRILDFCALRKYDIDKLISNEAAKRVSYATSDNIGQSLMFTNQLLCEAYEDAEVGSTGLFLASAINALYAISNKQGFDLIQHIELKMKYNATREHKHGKKY